ncbi:MAG TPA: 4Fe-4S dicluster domain-containing protein, partial [Planctomycetota bacterium]|nr:4Fe-4S dicluster domain-containing protein [Planctomycetota bacterium]
MSARGSDDRAGAAHSTPADARRQWRSLRELSPQPAAPAESPRHDQVGAAGDLARREVLQLAGASLALAGLGACTRQPPETILPYASSPESIVPGKPLFFATAMPFASGALGILVESHMGRPTKIEGNPDHPSSLGAADVFAQAAVLGLCDPERSKAILHRGSISTWRSFTDAIGTAISGQRPRQGAGLRILSETVISPALADALARLLRDFPLARWHAYEPVTRDHERAGARLAFGRDVSVLPRLERARVVLSLGADFLGGPGGVRNAKAFSATRRVREDARAMSRLYALESSPSITGAMADHRLALRPAELARLAGSLARELGLAVPWPESAEHREWVRAAAEDLRSAGTAALVLAGIAEPPAVHALAHAMNAALGAAGSTVDYLEPISAGSEGAAGAGEEASALRGLVDEMNAGVVDLLVVLGANPVYCAPADLAFASAYRKVRRTVHLGLYADETAALSTWHVPEAHFLESWGDARAADGTVSIVQPLIAPLYGGRTALEIVSAMAGEPGLSAYELVRAFWRRRRGDEGFEAFWRRSLHDGLVAGTAFEPLALEVGELKELPAAPEPGGLAFVFRPDPSVWDGRFANNAWLQECPRPLTKITWENALLVAPATAARLDLEDGDVVELAGPPGSGLGGVRGAVLRLPGHAEECITLPLGYGRSMPGKLADGLGFDAYRLRTAQSPWIAHDLRLAKTGERREPATTQEHHRMEGRDPVRVGRPADLREAGGPEPELRSLFPSWEYPGHAWGMVIDLTTCTGCNACVVACQAENNVPVVGREEVRAGREMHWIRVDRYFEGEAESPRTYFQPVPCMHCETAPCEVVCPVAATVHDSEGLNQMVYNRCVGTRYCSNNCPYKVRRFNFLNYGNHDDVPV